MVKVALITGVTGQDGSYLTELLLSKDYEVHGIIRRSSTFNTGRICHLYEDPNTHTNGRMKLHYGDLTDTSVIFRLVTEIDPDEVYNLAAQSHVKVSFELPEYTANVDALGALRILDAIRATKSNKNIKFYQASSSEMFGKVREVPQSETTPFNPRSPYATSKVFAHWITVNYRESYGIFACNGIMFNHESPRRGETFVTRKITRAVAKIHLGVMEFVTLGNLDAQRDWGHAADYVKAMWLMLQQDKAEDFVIGTGKCHTVRQFAYLAFSKIGLFIKWSGNGLNEQGIDQNGYVRVKVDGKFLRPNEVDILVANISKAKDLLRWYPEKSFDDVCTEMVASDIKLMKLNPGN